jgi:hypothetical protein
VRLRLLASTIHDSLTTSRRASSAEFITSNCSGPIRPPFYSGETRSSEQLTRESDWSVSITPNTSGARDAPLFPVGTRERYALSWPV